MSGFGDTFNNESEGKHRDQLEEEITTHKRHPI